MLRLGDNRMLRSPNVYGFDLISDKEIEDEYDLKLGGDAKKNKLAGLYVEKKDYTFSLLKFFLP